jgi:hypothetical protein
MKENLKQMIALVLHERMKTKAALEMMRALEEDNFNYKREIDKLLDRMNELDAMYERLIKE